MAFPETNNNQNSIYSKNQSNIFSLDNRVVNEKSQSKETKIGGISRVVQNITSTVKNFINDKMPDVREKLADKLAMLSGAAVLVGIFASFVSLVAAFAAPISLVGIPIFLIAGFAAGGVLSKIRECVKLS